MKRLRIQEPVSGGMLLSYRCTSECKHCMYACSPRWANDWISEEDLENVLSQLSGRIRGSPIGVDRIGVNFGLHFTGGEPFLNYDLLVKAVETAHYRNVPSTFVETNAFWCIDDYDTETKLMKLKQAGLHGILISVNPFILEQVPFERTERAVRVARRIFRENVILYQEFFYSQFKRLGIKDALPLARYLERIDVGDLYGNVELLPMGRAAYKLAHFFRKCPADQFFGESCRDELSRGWHIHVDNYCNYMTGYCGGVSLGDGRDINTLCQGIDLEKRPIVKTLVTDLKELFHFGVERFDYKQREDGYISKCHLCVDIRRHIAERTDEFKELRPREFYLHLS